MNEKQKVIDRELTQEDGFMSEQDAQQQFLYTAPENVDDFLHATDDERARIKLEISSMRDIASKNYSLEPDMITGWVPKVELPKPIPLTFVNEELDYMIDFVAKNKRNGGQKRIAEDQQKIMVCYRGARYESTYYAWFHKELQFPYRHLSTPHNMKIPNRFSGVGFWQSMKQNILEFDSQFESGNLDCAMKVGQNQYDLFIRVDSNTRGHLQWYNFKIKNIQIGINYKFNICNFQKGKSLYTRGMRPYCYSSKKWEYEHVGWHQIQSQTKYRRKISKTQKLLEYQLQYSKYYQLTFQFSTKYQKDQMQFAYCVPYTFTQLKQYLNELTSGTPNRSSIVSLKKLCTTLGGYVIDQITITQNVDEEQQAYKTKTRLKKKVVFITGRCHPGEANGSWMVEGVIDFLCGNSEMAAFMRLHLIFKIIPLLNPDGVIIGNYRTGLFGRDFNREFDKPDKDLFPEIYSLKQMFWCYKQIYHEDAFIYLDFHGHSVKKNVFAYGPEYGISHKNYYEARMIPKLISTKTNMFRYYSCSFKISQSKEATGRAIFLKSHKIPFTFTIQASNGSYFDQDQMNNCDFNQHKWKQVGQKVIQGIHDYLKLIMELQRIKQIKLRQRKQILMRNRERRQPKKSKITKAGYSTSMGFRKSKASANIDIIQPDNNQYKYDKINFTLNDLLSNVDGISGSAEGVKKFSQIFLQIKKQENDLRNNKNKTNKEGEAKEAKKQSDDQISEGSSDNQGSKDDLHESALKQLLTIIKENKVRANQLRHTKIKVTTTNININRKLKTMYDIQRQSIQQQVCLITQQKQQQYHGEQRIDKNNKKYPFNKKYLWKKKNIGCTSYSPKKQDLGLAAKIVNFNFSLNPIQCTLSSNNNSNNNNNNNNNNNINIINSNNHQNGGYHSVNNVEKTSVAALSTKVQERLLKTFDRFGTNALVSTQGESFKKAFIGVQKQVIKRQNYKRNAATKQNIDSQNKIKHFYIIQNHRNSNCRKDSLDQRQDESNEGQRDKQIIKFKQQTEPYQLKQKMNIAKKNSKNKLIIQAKNKQFTRQHPLKNQIQNNIKYPNTNSHSQSTKNINDHNNIQQINKNVISLDKMTSATKKNKQEYQSQGYMKKFKVKRAKTTIYCEELMENKR